MKKTDIAEVLKKHERENNVNSEHRIIIAEKDFKQLIDDLFSLTDVVKPFYCHDNKFGKMYQCLSQCRECKRDELKQ